VVLGYWLRETSKVQIPEEKTLDICVHEQGASGNIHEEFNKKI